MASEEHNDKKPLIWRLLDPFGDFRHCCPKLLHGWVLQAVDVCLIIDLEFSETGFQVNAVLLGAWKVAEDWGKSAILFLFHDFVKFDCAEVESEGFCLFEVGLLKLLEKAQRLHHFP